MVFSFISNLSMNELESPQSPSNYITDDRISSVNEQTILLGLSWLYSISAIALAIFGLNIFFLLGLAIFYWGKAKPADPPDEWPDVLVQLPLYNERYVVERLINAAIQLDYPKEHILIQVLDDSTDDTAKLAEAHVRSCAANGCPIVYRHRTQRSGYKAGALQEGLQSAPGEFIALFDADFIPPPDFLKQTIPEFIHNPQLGIVQTRWGHLNAEQNLVTRAMALAFDNFFSIDQVARSGPGLLMGFNGSACVLRRACIEDVGGWQSDTLVEDLDLSYQVQLRGWRIKYRPDVVVPGELPVTILALKQQQYRWAKGSIQILMKLGKRLLTSNKPWFIKIQGLLHITGYISHPLIIALLLLSLPVVLLHGSTPVHWSVLGVAALAPVLSVFWSQWRLHEEKKIGWIFYPALLMVGIGLAVTDTRAIWDALWRKRTEFVRTPKFGGADHHTSDYALPVDLSTWVELALALYGLGTTWLAWTRAPELTLFILFYSLGFGLTAVLGFLQSKGMRIGAAIKA